MESFQEFKPTTAIVDGIISKLLVCKSHEERSIQRKKIYALGPESAPYLLKWLKHEDDFLRWDIVSFLGEFANPNTLKRTVEFALNEEEVHARWRSFWAVTRFNKEQLSDLLMDALESNSEMNQWHAALILNMLGDQAALPHMIKGLKASDHWKQWEALSALKAFKLRGTEKHIAPFLSEEIERDLRQEAVLALGHIGSKKSFHLLKDKFKDPSHHVRWRVSFALCMCNEADAIPIIENQLELEKNEEVREQLQQDLYDLKSNHYGSKSKKKTAIK